MIVLITCRVVRKFEKSVTSKSIRSRVSKMVWHFVFCWFLYDFQNGKRFTFKWHSDYEGVAEKFENEEKTSFSIRTMVTPKRANCIFGRLLVGKWLERSVNICDGVENADMEFLVVFKEKALVRLPMRRWEPKLTFAKNFGMGFLIDYDREFRVLNLEKTDFFLTPPIASQKTSKNTAFHSI